MIDGLMSLMEGVLRADDPCAPIALVARRRGEVGPLVAARLAALSGLCAAREGPSKYVGPRLRVTSERRFKGLELDGVSVHEPTEPAYPATGQGRRDLYTVLTRARDRLVLVSREAPASLLLSAADAGLIDVLDAAQVPSAALGALDAPSRTTNCVRQRPVFGLHGCQQLRQPAAHEPVQQVVGRVGAVDGGGHA